ncbi:MAG: response regulator, partial [Limisphaerales bacterium]
RLGTQKVTSSAPGGVLENAASSPQHRGFTRPQPRSAQAGPGPVKVLLIGAQKARLGELEAGLLRAQPGWACRSSNTGTEALEAIASSFFDVLVLQSAQGEGLEFLQKLTEASPRTTRFVLGDHARTAAMASHLRAETEFLHPDTEAGIVAEEVARTLTVQQWMSGPSMKKLLSSIHKLPTPPRVHMQIVEKLRDPDGSLEEVSQLVAQDPVMTGKFLQIVNSACFALARTITDPSEAVMFLGSERTRSLVLMANVFSQFDGMRCPGFSPEEVWNHSTRVASLARGIALIESEDPKMAEMAFTAGLLHEIGNLVLAGNAPEMFATVRRFQSSRQLPLVEAEREMLGTTTALLGACLLGTWKLPLPILEAVAWHG